MSRLDEHLPKITVSPEHRLELRCADAEFRAAAAELKLLELQVIRARDVAQQAALNRDAVSQTVRDAYGLDHLDTVDMESGDVTRAATPAPVVGHAEGAPRGQA